MIGHVDVVVPAARLERGVAEAHHLVVLAGGEERAQQEVVGALGVGLPLDHLAHQGDGLVVLPLGVEDPALGHQHLGQVAADGARLLGGRHRAADPALRPLVVVVELRAGVRDRGVGERERGVERDRVLEHLERELEVLAGQPPREALAAEVEVVGLQALRGLDGERLLLLRRELDAQRLGDLPRDLVLHLEDVRHLAVVALGPQREVGLGVHELRRDAQPLPRPAQACR